MENPTPAVPASTSRRGFLGRVFPDSSFLLIVVVLAALVAVFPSSRTELWEMNKGWVPLWAQFSEGPVIWILIGFEIWAMTLGVWIVYKLLRRHRIAAAIRRGGDHVRKRDWRAFWVMTGAFASGGLCLLVLATFVGAYHPGVMIIPLEALQRIEEVWPFLMLGYIITQIIPMLVRYQTQGIAVATDQFTSVLAFIGTVVILAAWAFGVFPIGPEGWRMLAQVVLVNFIDLLLLVLGNKLIAAARGSEETAVRN